MSDKAPAHAMTLSDVWIRVNWDYEKKLEHAKMVIESAIETHGNKLAVACSFGKSSLVALHLTLQIKPDVIVSFQNTLCQERGIYKLKERLVKEWDLNLKETRPLIGLNFWKIQSVYGFPSFKITRGEGHQQPQCCYLLKEGPAKDLYKELGIEGVILGIQAVESYNRRYLLARKGCIYYRKDEKLWKYQPVGFFQDKDIWKYINENGLPYAEEYDLVDRTGCRFCTAYSKWEQNMSKLHPIIYRKIKRMMGKPTLLEFCSSN